MGVPATAAPRAAAMVVRRLGAPATLAEMAGRQRVARGTLEGTRAPEMRGVGMPRGTEAPEMPQGMVVPRGVAAMGVHRRIRRRFVAAE